MPFYRILTNSIRFWSKFVFLFICSLISVPLFFLVLFFPLYSYACVCACVCVEGYYVL